MVDNNLYDHDLMRTIMGSYLAFVIIIGFYQSLIEPKEGSILENLNPLLLIKVLPSIDLEVSVNLTNFSLNCILVTGNHELLLFISVVIWSIHNKTNLGNLSTIWLNKFKIKNGPSKDKE